MKKKRITHSHLLKVLSTALVITMLLFQIPVYATDYDISESETANTTATALTEASVYNAMISLKTEYYEGMPWTNANGYSWKGGIYSTGYGCAGFAFRLSDEAFGTLPARIHHDWDNVRVGDILRINNDSHSVIVLTVNGNSVTVAEGNFNSSIHWGRTITLSNYSSNSNNYIMTRWPEGTQSVDTSNITAFVTRLYNTCLNRQPDTEGLAHWVELLSNGSLSGAEVGRRFVFSTEYNLRNTSDEEYVEMLYTVFMDRASDSDGKTHWLELLNQGVSREYIFRGFAQSTEYTIICTSYGIERGSVSLSQARDQNVNLTKYVNRLYVQALGRNGEEDGLNHWCSTIQKKVKTPEAVAEAFINSAEFTNRNLSDEEYIKVLYRTFMGREYDQEGFEHWMGELNNGCSRQNILHRFATSAEFKAIQSSFGL